MTNIRTMTTADIPLGMRLKCEANWNQTEADWRRFLAMEPGGCFVAEYEGEPVGTLATTVFGDIAWISMVLVDARMRGKGLGTSLMKHALAYLDGRGVPTVRLDATPMGQPLYEKLGFTADFRLQRFESEIGGMATVPGRQSAGGDASPPDISQNEEIIRFDRDLTGTDRRKMLIDLLENNAEDSRVVVKDGKLQGYLLARPGVRAWQIGPALADEEAGRLLFADAFCRYAGQQVFIDVPEDNAPAIAAVTDIGLTIQRPFMRMSRGPRPAEQAKMIWASSGPEKG